MDYKWATLSRDFKFKFDAGTSRGVLKNKLSTFLILSNDTGDKGIGEAGPLKGLSEEYGLDLENLIYQRLKEIQSGMDSLEDWIREEYDVFSSLKFAIETAYLDLKNGGIRKIYDTPFFTGKKEISINGLVWMGDYDFMHQQMLEKLQAGFKCIKIKIGALDIDTEMSLIRELRNDYSKKEIEIRVDANGAFNFDQAKEIMRELNRLDIHSIEQPLPAGDIEKTSMLAAEYILPIALDEELIGKRLIKDKIEILQSIKPQYIVLKPSLHGGLYETSEWIKLAEKEGIGWWVTSALESNIGLNAISQFVSQYNKDIFHGLGTGQLYENNISSPLKVEKGKIKYDLNSDWDLSGFE